MAHGWLTGGSRVAHGGINRYVEHGIGTRDGYTVPVKRYTGPVTRYTDPVTNYTGPVTRYTG